MDVVREFAQQIIGFLERHEAIVGRVALISAAVEREVNKLFGYVFNLDFESRSIITRNIPSMSRKISVLRQGLVQEGCRIPSGQKLKLENGLASLQEFISVRNNLVHGSILPDFERINRELDQLKAHEGDEQGVLNSIKEIMAHTIVVPQFEPKTGDLKYIKYSVADVEQQIEAAKMFVSIVQEVFESLKSQFDWIGIVMPRSEIRKLSE